MKKYETRYRVVENSSYNDFNSELPYTIVTVDYDPSTKKIRQRGFNTWTDHKCDLFTTRKLAENWFVSLVNNSFVTAMKAENIELKKKLAEKDKEIECLKDNWNVLCDYLGDCIAKFDEEDIYGIYCEVLDKVNILKRYDYKRHQDKIEFAIAELKRPRDWCIAMNENNKLNGYQKEPNLENLATLIDQQIEKLRSKYV